MSEDVLEKLLRTCSEELWESFLRPGVPAAPGQCISLPLLERAASKEKELFEQQWEHLSGCRLCAGALARFLKAVAAVIVDLGSLEIFTPLPGFGAEPVYAKAAGIEEVETIERGLVDLVLPAPAPPGACIEAVDETKTLEVRVPCNGPFEKTAPRIELLLGSGQIRTTTLEQKTCMVHETPGDVTSSREELCWVGKFENVEPGRVLAIIVPQALEEGLEGT